MGQPEATIFTSGSITAFQQSEVIQNEDYEHPQSSLHMSMTTVELLMEQAREADMNNEFPVYVHGLFQRVLDAGYGEEEVAALIKIMR